MKVYVRSKRVPVQSFACERLVPSVIGSVKITKWVVQYESRLDDDQQAILKYADDLSASAGLPIEIVDVSKLNIVRRLILKIFKNELYKAPAVVFSGIAISNVMRRVYLMPTSTITANQYNLSGKDSPLIIEATDGGS